MDQIEIYIVLFCIIAIIGVLFSKAPVPIPLLLVMSGMLLSFFPPFQNIMLEPKIILNVFLPMLLYQISSSSSWKDVKSNMRPIALLSIGHVVFITFLVAITVHWLIPEIGWPMAFVLGAVISPPDDVAIVAIAEKIHMPNRIVTILEGEGMLNDATALILFRFALAAVMTHQFSPVKAVSTFFIVVICETIYGLALGNVLGQLRLKIHDPILHMLVSFLTPFLAYLPAEKLGGSGVLATVVTGFVIGHVYSVRFSPEFRLLSRSIWPTISFAIQCILFLLLGLEMQFIIARISSIPAKSLLLYSGIIILVVIIGRFVWVYPAAYLPRFFFRSIRKKDPYPPWQYPFVVAWAGMRGAISLAAALAVPALPMVINGVNPKDLLLFLVFCVIAATLILQGLTLPWILKVLGLPKHGLREKYDNHVAELIARYEMTKEALRWLKDYKKTIKDDCRILTQVEFQIHAYKMLKEQLKENIINHDADEKDVHDEKSELHNERFISSQIIKAQRAKLLLLWHENKISYTVKNKLLEQLDHLSKHLPR